MWRTDRWTDRHRHRTATMCDNSGRWDAVLLRHIDLPCRSFRHSGTRKCSDVINAWLPTCRTHLIQSISKHAWQFVLYKSIFCNQRRLTNYKILRHMTWHMTWHDMAWHDMTYDTTWHDMTYDMTHDMTWHMTWHDMAWHDMTYDMTWHDMTWHDIWHDMTHDMTWHMTYDMTWHDMTWHTTWHDIWHDTWHDMTWHDMTYDMTKLSSVNQQQIHKTSSRATWTCTKQLE